MRNRAVIRLISFLCAALIVGLASYASYALTESSFSAEKKAAKGAVVTGLLECVVSLRKGLCEMSGGIGSSSAAALSSNISSAVSRALIYSSESGSDLRRFNDFLTDCSEYAAASAESIIESGSAPENFAENLAGLCGFASECERQLLSSADLIFTDGDAALDSVARLERLFDNYFPPNAEIYASAGESGADGWATLENQPLLSIAKAKDAGKELLGKNLTLKVSDGARTPGTWLVTCDSAYAEITKAGGLPLRIASSREISEPRLSEKEALSLLDAFVAKYYPAVSRVSCSGGSLTVKAEYCPISNGEADENCRIDAEIALDCGRLVFFDAEGYLKNYV